MAARLKLIGRWRGREATRRGAARSREAAARLDISTGMRRRRLKMRVEINRRRRLTLVFLSAASRAALKR